MDPIEQRVRESLRARAGDAEPTPHLYRGVQDRIARRRRLKVLTWVPAGAAALGVAVAIPFVLSSDPEVPRIEDYAEEQGAVGPRAPDRVLLHDGESLRVLDLADGTSVDVAGLEAARSVTALDVPAADRGEVPTWLAATVEDGRPTLRVGRPDGEVARTSPATIEGTGGVAISEDGAWVAYLTTPPEADGLVLTATRTDSFGDQLSTPTTVSLGNVGDGARVLDWAGSTDGTTRAPSEILVATANGTLTSFSVLAADGLTAAGDPSTVEDTVEVLAASLAHDGSPEPTASRYQLEQDGDRRVVRVVGRASGELDVTGLVGDTELGAVWLDAWGDATLLGDLMTGEVWLLSHDGAGSFADPVALPEGTVAAALVGRDVAAAPDIEETEPPIDPDDGASEEAPAVGTLPGAVVVTDANAVVLRRADGSELDLVRYPPPPEGEGMNLAAAVRPGSTSDDLTVVVARLSEGATDLRSIEVVDGQVREPVTFEGAHAPASATDPQVTIQGLAWTPDGEKLLWVERRTDGGVQLRSIGWAAGPGTGGPATDNAAFGMPDVFAGRLVDVRDAGGGRLVARFAPEEADDGWYRWILELQGDGAIAVPGTEPEQVASPVSDGGVVALAGADEESRPTWLLLFEDGGKRLVADPYGAARDLPVPDELWSGDHLPETWLHELGDGVLVVGDGNLWFIGADGEPIALGAAVDADPVR